MASNGILVEYGHDSFTYPAEPEEIRKALQEIVDYLKGYYSNDFDKKELTIQVTNSDPHDLGEIEGI